MKARRHYADDRENAPTDRSLLPEHVVVTTKALLPKFVAENGNEVLAGSIFTFRKPPADEWLDAKRGKKPRRNDLRLHFDRLACSGEIHARVPDRSHVFKRAARLLPIEKICRGDDVLVVGILGGAFPHYSNAIGLRVNEVGRGA